MGNTQALPGGRTSSLRTVPVPYMRSIAGSDSNDDSSSDSDSFDLSENKLEVAFKDSGTSIFKKRCKKNPGHKNFIPMAKLQLFDFPEEWQDRMVFTMVKAVAQTVVKVTANHTSPHRPDDYPREDSRHGTGRALICEDDRKKTLQNCPLRNCPIRRPHKVTPEFRVLTVAHVVFDDIECEHTTVTFDLDSSGKVEAQVIGMSASLGKVGESCIIRCVSHDTRLFDKVLTKMRPGPRRRRQRDPLLVVISHPHGLEKCITFGRLSDIVDETKATQDQIMESKIRSVRPMGEAMSGILEETGKFTPDQKKQYLDNLPDLAGKRIREVAFTHVTRIIPPEVIEEAEPSSFSIWGMFASVGRWVVNNLASLKTSIGSWLTSFARALGGIIPGVILDLIVSDAQTVCEENDISFETLGDLLNKEGVNLPLHATRYTNDTCPGSSGAPAIVIFDKNEGDVCLQPLSLHFGVKRGENASSLMVSLGDEPALKSYINRFEVDYSSSSLEKLLASD